MYRIGESLYGTPETNRRLYINYTDPFIFLFSSQSFIAVALAFRLWCILSKLLYMVGGRGGQLFFANPVVSAIFVEKILAFPLNGLGTLVANQSTTDVQAFYSTDLYILVPVWHCLGYSRFEVNFKIGKCESSIRNSFKFILTILGVLKSCMHYRIELLISINKSIETSMWIMLHLWISFRSTAIIKKLILSVLIHEHGIFPIITSSLAFPLL